MATDVSICNVALALMGHQEQITALSENTTAGRLCNLFYAQTRDAMLREYPWNFAIRRTTLAASATTPNHEYTYQYPMPADWIRMVRTEDEALGYAGDYRIESNSSGQRVLLTNESTVKIEYVAQITDATLYDPQFVDCMSYRLAAQLAMSLANNSASAERLAQMYEGKIAHARNTDSQEHTSRPIEADYWLTVRL